MYTTEYCCVCGFKISDNEWCFETRDGDHRPKATLDRSEAQ